MATIYEADINNNQKLIVLFNPLINSLIFEKISPDTNGTREFLHIELDGSKFNWSFETGLF